MQVKKIPMRTCIVTKEKLPKKELLRIVKFDGKIKPDLTGKHNGRGCYLKKDVEVIEKARHNKILDRVFETSVDDKIYDEILELIN